MQKIKFLFIGLLPLLAACDKTTTTDPDPTTSTEILYTMPDESEPHEGTWLQWPHHHQYELTATALTKRGWT